MSDTLSLRLPIFTKLGWPNFGINLRLITGIVISLTLLLLTVYLFQLGELARTNYLVESYEAEIEKIASQNLNLQVKSTELLALEKIGEKIRELDFVKIARVTYIPISSSYLVRKTN